MAQSKGQEEAAGQAIMSKPSPVLVSWQHESIPSLAAAVVGRPDITPATWPDLDYDSIWLLERDTQNTWRFLQLSQRLLDGDLA
ncbi:hypothetical protein B5V01_21685 [Mesorhizobium erdmanii]|uniref:Uncharacterized protein n=2 Tax=Mesorhizobium TaxID=68287 RepID=A0A3M9X1B3_9HYPH|nr:hypothetical protein DNR46_31890 [Mesorhizobium japonicum]RXT42847.1 hypothetical protein B5V01_21685 [Mesorhizobium erdmanii]